jgi:hypothetical protein
MRGKTYEGIHNDRYGGMTVTGAIVKDAWIFGLIPESETCEGWSLDRMQLLYDQVAEQRERMGFEIAKYPPEIRERHERIHREAIERARALGWDADRDISDEG